MTTSTPQLLHGLPEDDAARITAFGVAIRLASGETLFELGNDADCLYHLVRGRIALSLPMMIRDRRESIVVEEKGPGETVGWSALVPPHRFTLRAAASVDSELLAFSRTALLGYFAEHPAAGYTVTRNVAAVIGRRLQLIQTMWLREMQRVVELRHS